MSHFTRIATKIRDTALLTSALEALGFRDIEVSPQPQTLYGFQGDARPERAEVIIRREHIGRLSNDIGFAKQPDGSYQAIISEYDRAQFDTAWLTSLIQSYSYAATVQYAETHGYEIATDEVQEDGSRRLTLRRFT
jgi:hypothetical protein